MHTGIQVSQIPSGCIPSHPKSHCVARSSTSKEGQNPDAHMQYCKQSFGTQSMYQKIAKQIKLPVQFLRGMVEIRYTNFIYCLINEKKKSSILIVNYLLRISSAQVLLKLATVAQQIFLVNSGQFLKHFFKYTGAQPWAYDH